MKRLMNNVVRSLQRKDDKPGRADERKAGAQDTRRRVWRISESAPGGEWVDPDAPLRRHADTSGRDTDPGSWTSSSMDLLDGAEVTEFCPDTRPLEPDDELPAPADSSPRNRRG